MFVSRFPSEQIYSTERENWDHFTPSNSPRARGTTSKFGKRNGPSQGIIQKCEPHERDPCAPKFEERTQDETLQQERCARRVAWDLAKHVYKLNKTDKATFCFPIEATAMSAPTSKSPEEREVAVDHGGSMHTEKSDLRSEELETLRRSRTPTTVVTASGEVPTNQEAVQTTPHRTHAHAHFFSCAPHT